MLSSRLTATLLLVAALAIGTSWASIENGPVKVTHRNSGPRYDLFDDVEKTKLTSDNEANTEPRLQPPPVDQASGSDQPDEPVGRISIRRIFLVPVSSPNTDNIFTRDPIRPQRDGDDESNSSNERPSMMSGSPFWPFMMPPTRRQHLFGADSASRSPTPEASNERPQTSMVEQPNGEREDERPKGLLIDPLQMMIDMMHQALNSQANPNFFNDLNKEASGENSGDENNKSGSEVERPIKPASDNETKVDIVEIDGKKFMRKTVINRHIGEGIVFMTKRLIFTPLNETTDSTEMLAIPTTTPVAQTTARSASTSTIVPTIDETSTVSLPEAPKDEIERSTTSSVVPEAPSTTPSTETPVTSTTSESTISTEKIAEKEEPTMGPLGTGTDIMSERLTEKAPSSGTGEKPAEAVATPV